MLILKNPLLDSFEAISRLGTAHAAAKELGVSQTAITQRIKALEEGMGVTLFLRSRKGMVITEEGKALLQYQKNIVEAEGTLIAQITGEHRSEISLTLIGPTSTISSRVADNCLPLYAKFPFLKLNLQSEDHKDLVQIIKRGEADLAIINPQFVPNEFHSKLLKPEKYLLVATSKWKGRDLKDILTTERIIDFYKEDNTTINYLKKFQFDSLSKLNRLYVNENATLVKFLIHGIGIGTLTESIAKSYLEDGSLIKLNRGQVLEDSLALVWYSRSKQLKYFEEIIRSIK
jgi:DNA-binding transcriptional LysR family regulator